MQFTGLLNRGHHIPVHALIVASCLVAGRPLAAQNPGDTSHAQPPAAAPTPPPPASTPGQSAPTVKVSGVVYAQFEYWAKDSVAHTNQFDVTRAYLNALGNFSHGVSTRVTVDVFRNSGANTSLAYRLKYAYVDWKPQPTSPVDFRFGLTHTPWIDWQESLYGFRMQGPVPMDRYGYLTSSDYGLSMNFATKDQAVNGTVGAYNGEGYGSAPGGRFLDYEARASIRLLPSDDNSPRGGLRVSGYAGLGRTDVVGGPARNRYVAEASYKSKLITLAAEGGFAKSDTVNGRVLSAFGVLNVPGSPVQLLARVDRLDPSTDVDGDASTRFIGGVAYNISSNLRVLGDVDAVSYQDLTKQSAANQRQRSKLLFQTEINF